MQTPPPNARIVAGSIGTGKATECGLLRRNSERRPLVPSGPEYVPLKFWSEEKCDTNTHCFTQPPRDWTDQTAGRLNYANPHSKAGVCQVTSRLRMGDPRLRKRRGTYRVQLRAQPDTHLRLTSAGRALWNDGLKRRDPRRLMHTRRDHAAVAAGTVADAAAGGMVGRSEEKRVPGDILQPGVREQLPQSVSYSEVV